MKKILWITSIAALLIGGVLSSMADYTAPYSDAYQTVNLVHMDEVRSSKYMEDDNSFVTGRNADWVMSPNPTNGWEIVDPAVTAGLGYPAGNADFGSCYYLNGTNNLAIGNASLDAAGLNIANLRMEFWAQSDAAVSGQYIFDRWGQILVFSDAAGFRVRVYDASEVLQDILARPAGFVATNWNHLAVEVTGEDVDVFVNGDLVNSTTVTGGLSPTTSKTTTFIGQRYNQTGKFAGYLDEFRIMDTGTFGDLVTYSDWANSYGLTGSETNLTADLEYGGLGDGADNMTEWALGGNPYLDDAATLAIYTIDDTLMSVSYERRLRADELDLEYNVEQNDDLMDSGGWTNEGVSEVSSIIDTEVEAVTNSVASAGGEKDFLRLQIVSGPQVVTPLPPDPCAYDLPLATVTPTIDGTISAGEYDDAYYNPLSLAVATNGCGGMKYSEPTSDADFSIDTYLKWDATYLYIGIKVYDDTLTFGTTPYPNDHVNLAFNPYLSGVVQDDIAFYQMARSAAGTNMIVNAYNQDLNSDNAVIASAVQGDGYSIEVAYAWVDLGITPAEGQKHSTLIMGVDNDSGLPDWPLDGATTDTFLFDAGEGNSNPISVLGNYRKVTLGPAL